VIVPLLWPNPSKSTSCNTACNMTLPSVKTIFSHTMCVAASWGACGGVLEGIGGGGGGGFEPEETTPLMPHACCPGAQALTRRIDVQSVPHK
jgi:hypothetical protein